MWLVLDQFHVLSDLLTEKDTVEQRQHHLLHVMIYRFPQQNTCKQNLPMGGGGGGVGLVLHA